MATTRLPSEEGVIQNVSHHASLSPGAGAWILAATIPGTSLYYIDSNVVNIALPALQRDLHATAAAVQWVFEAYTLLLSALILVGGALGDAVGRRRIAPCSRLAAAQVPSTVSPAVRVAQQQAIGESFVAGFRVIMLVSAGLALVGALVIALLVPSGYVRQSAASERPDDTVHPPAEAENEATPQDMPISEGA